MTKTKEQLITKARSNLGSPSETELTDTQIGDSIDSAINEYSKYKPKKVYAEFETEADVATKDITDVITDSTVLSLVDCFYDPTGIFFDSDLYYTLPEASITGLSGLSLFNNPSLVVQYQQKLEAFKNHFGGDWDFYDNTLRLFPPPSTTGIKVGLIANCSRALADIPDIDEDLLLLGIEGKAGKILSVKQAEIASVSMEGASISFDTGKTTMTTAENKEKDFKKAIGGHLGAFSIG